MITENVPLRGKNYGRQFKQLREALGLKQADVATRTGIPPAYISLIENGKILPLGSWAHQIQEVLNWPTAQGPTSKLSTALSVPAALYEALWQERARTSRRTGRQWTWREFIAALLLYWQAFPPAQLPTQAELQEWYR